MSLRSEVDLFRATVVVDNTRLPVALHKSDLDHTASESIRMQQSLTDCREELARSRLLDGYAERTVTDIDHRLVHVVLLVGLIHCDVLFYPTSHYTGKRGTALLAGASLFRLRLDRRTTVTAMVSMQVIDRSATDYQPVQIVRKPMLLGSDVIDQIVLGRLFTE